MTETDPNSVDRSEPQPSQRLSDDLKGLYGSAASVPPIVDERVLTAARRRFARQRRARSAVRWLSATVAAAAVLALVFVPFDSIAPPAGVPDGGWAKRAPTSAVREDVDGNGRVDILDAFTLARNVEAVTGLKPEWDINGDGVVDHRDIDTVALAAVRLDQGVLQ